MAARPCFVTPMKWWHPAVALMAFTATWTPPSVPFLNPTGNDTPDASSRWSWDSVVRAPTAPRLIRSSKYWGEMVSSISVMTGNPISVMSAKSWRDVRRPLLILKVLFRSGSLIRPFHPTLVLGFSRYARMTMQSSPDNLWLRSLSLRAYSSAASGSCMEQGPTATSKRSDFWRIMELTCLRPWKIVRIASFDWTCR